MRAGCSTCDPSLIHSGRRFAFRRSGGGAFPVGPLAIRAGTAAIGARRAFTLGALLARLTLLAITLLIAILLRLRLRRRLRLWRGKARVHLGHVVIEIAIIAVGAHPALGLLGARNNAEIMLGVLEIVLRHHRVATRLRITGQLQIFLCHMGRVAAHLHIRAVALEIARQWIDVLASTVPATLAVLVILVAGSHLVALSNSRKISVTLLADRHRA